MDFWWVGLFLNALLSLVGAYVATEKGRSGLAFWLLGVFLSFLIALLVAIGIPKAETAPTLPSTKHSHKNCPDCAEQILVQAVKCKHCGAKQPAIEKSNVNVRSWCPFCKSESNIPPQSACPNCGKGTHPSD